MPLQNDFLPFATGAGANVLSQSAYAALSAVSTGYQAGVAQSAALNKTWRLSSIMSAVLAQLINNNAGQPAVDDGTTATLISSLTTAISVIARQNPVLTDTGAANAYVVANAAAFTAYPTVSGLTIDVAIANTNNGASTLKVDTLATKPILGLGLQPLQGNELVQNGVALLLYVVAPTVNAGNGAWILLECTGGSQQVPPATQPLHAPQYGQVRPGRLLNIQTFSVSGTYTPTTGTNFVKVRGIGGGGGGGGTPATGVGQSSSGGGGATGSYGEAYINNTAAQTITIGAGGTASAGSSGGTGGTSSFGALVSFPGGGGGSVGTVVSAWPTFGASGGLPGSAPSGANVLGTPGSEGGYGHLLSASLGTGGVGASSQLGAGGQHTSGGAGNNGLGRGSGGSGASAYASQAALAGGVGSNGLIIIEEYA